MSFTIPHLADAAFADQSEPDNQDFRIVTDASGLTGVVSGLAVFAFGRAVGFGDLGSGALVALLGAIATAAGTLIRA